MSGPLLDRIDIHVEVASVSAADLTLPPPAEGSREIAARVAKARDIQRALREGMPKPKANCSMPWRSPMRRARSS